MINKSLPGKTAMFFTSFLLSPQCGGGGGGGGYSRESLNKMSKFLLFAGAEAVVSNDICAYYIESVNTSILFCVM